MEPGFSVYQRQDIGRTGGPWISRGFEAWTAYQNIERTRRTLPAKKLFEIRQGVRLGNDVFVVAKQYVQKLRKSERQFFRPAVMNVSISNAKLTDTYYVFYPYTRGLAEISTEEELEQNVPTYFKERLLPVKAKLSSRKSLKKADLNWWDLLWHRAWQQDLTPKIVSKYFGGERSFAFDRTGEFVVVVGNAWLLRKGAVPLAITDEEVYCALLAYLSSEVATDLMEYVSIQVSGGQWDLSNRYVGNLPIPNFSKLGERDLSKLIQTGIRVSEGKVERWPEINELLVSILSR